MATIEVTPDEREYVRRFIEDNCIIRAKAGDTSIARISTDKAYSTGLKHYGWLFMLRPVSYNARAMKIITKDFFIRNHGVMFDRIRLSGIESSSVPMMIAFQQEAYRYGVNLDVISIRKKSKEYGYNQTIEGKVDFRPVMFVDELIGPEHKWSNYSINVLQKTQIPILDRVYSIVNKSLLKNQKIQIADEVFTHYSMFDLNDFKMTYEEYYGQS